MASSAPTESPRRDEYGLRFAFLVSSVGDWIYRFALPLLVLELTGSALSTAFTYVIEFIPYVVIGLFAGNVADRADRRRLLITCDATSAAIVALITLVTLAGHPSVSILYAVAFLLASVRPFYFPAFQSFIVERVPGSRRASVNAWVQGTDSTLNLLGPVLGVTIVALMGPAVACAANAVSFAASATVIACTAHRPRATAWLHGVWGNLRADFVEGLRTLIGNGPLLWGTVLMTVTNFAVLAVESNLIFLIAGPRAAAGPGLGIVFGAQGAGSLIGAAVAPRLIRRVQVGRLLTAGMAGLAVALLLPAVLPVGVPALAAAWLLAGVATSLIVVPWFTYRQDIVASDLIGRVSSVSRAVSYLTMPAGAVVGSWVITVAGYRYLFVVAAATQLAVWIGTVLSPLGRARHDASPETVAPQEQPDTVSRAAGGSEAAEEPYS